MSASDIHLSADNFVYFRQKNELKIDETYFFSSSDIISIVRQILSEYQEDVLRQQKVLDCAYTYADRRFRLNIFKAGKNFHMAMRLIRKNILNIDFFIKADVLKQRLQEGKGLILICGATGTGKSTTLASMLEYINRFYAKHIITLEDPVEYIFVNEKSLIQQREYNEDFQDFSQAVKKLKKSESNLKKSGFMRKIFRLQNTKMLSDSCCSTIKAN